LATAEEKTHKTIRREKQDRGIERGGKGKREDSANWSHL